MRIPTNNPQTGLNENNSNGQLNDQEDSAIGGGADADDKRFESTEINMGANSSVTPNNENV